MTLHCSEEKYQKDLVWMFNDHLNKIDRWISDPKVVELAIKHLKQILSVDTNLTDQKGKENLLQKQIHYLLPVLSEISFGKNQIPLFYLDLATNYNLKGIQNAIQLSQQVNEIEELFRNPSLYAQEEYYAFARKIFCSCIYEKIEHLPKFYESNQLATRQKEIKENEKARQLEQAILSKIHDQKNSTLSEFEHQIAWHIYVDLQSLLDQEISLIGIENFILRLKQYPDYQQLLQENKEEYLKSLLSKIVDLVVFLAERDKFFDGNSTEIWDSISLEMVMDDSRIKAVINAGISFSEFLALEEPTQIEQIGKVILLQAGVLLSEISALEEPLCTEFLRNAEKVAKMIKSYGFSLSEIVYFSRGSSQYLWDF